MWNPTLRKIAAQDCCKQVLLADDEPPPSECNATKSELKSSNQLACVSPSKSIQSLFSALKSLCTRPVCLILGVSGKKILKPKQPDPQSSSSREYISPFLWAKCSRDIAASSQFRIDNILQLAATTCDDKRNSYESQNHVELSNNPPATVLIFEKGKNKGFFEELDESPSTAERQGKLVVHGVDLQSKPFNSCPRFQFQELSMATSNFSEKNLLGKGSSGTVFRGKLPCGRRIAVKCLRLGSSEAEKDFITEIEIMSTVRNHHIVPLLGYGVEGHHLFLVYKFVRRGTLEKQLHGRGKPVISWRGRCKMAIGIAKGLHYLHTNCKRPVIHRDVKASNILISKGNRTKLSDFGLAMWAPQTFLISSEIMGTFGYLAPEYFQFGKISKKVDVYAFGVVMLELITGRKPIETNRPFGEENLVLWARPLIYGGYTEKLIDPRLKGLYSIEEMHRMMYTAVLCVHPTDTRRPSISQVLYLLEKQQDGNIHSMLKHENMNFSFTARGCMLSEDEQKKTDSVKECVRNRHFATAMADCSSDSKHTESATTALLSSKVD